MRYWTADVTDPDALAGAVAAVASELGPITGVIHAAGVAAGPVLMEGDWPEFERVLAPKALGLAALDRAVAAQPLEHFIVFSSLAAELGDFGQCAYAAANIVASRFAEAREAQRRKGDRRGRTVALCWPLWREGRRVLSAAGEELYLKTIGMPFLETADGLAAFDAALVSDVAQLVVMPGDPARAEALLSHEPEPTAAAVPPPRLIEPEIPAMAPAGSPPTPDDDLLPAIRRRLTSMVSRLLKIDQSRLGPGVGFGDFGFDSIALKDFAVEIGRAYGVVVTPAVFFAHGTIGALAQHLLTEHGAVVARVESPEPRTTEAPRAPDPTPSPSDGPRAIAASSAAERAVAIIGMAGRLPQSPDLDALWRHLAAGDDLVSEVPRDRWARASQGDGVASQRGGFIDDVDRFDAAFFHIAPREAVFMDPQHRLAIETAWHCVEDAGVRMSDLAGRPIGVFFAQQVNEYGKLMADQAGAEAQIALGNIATMLPNRISYLFDLQGPSEAIDTACSGALVAVHRAVRALLDEECELAIAGGVSLMLDPQGFATTSQLGVLSPDGCCRTFDAKANGYVKGEGVGAVLLKPLAAALRDRDPIRAVIRGSAVNHGGHAYSLTAPNAQAQTALVRAALKRAGVEASSIGYVEAHGTGTELGDPVEVSGLKAAFGDGIDGRPWCLLGSVKTNIGHLEPAAGIAGLIKTVLALEHGTIPASLHVEQLSPHLALENSPFAIATQTGPWGRPCGEAGEKMARRAGVSAFGFGGTNAHVILEEAPEQVPVAVADEAPRLIVLSARDPEALARLAERLAVHVADHPDLRVADIAWTLHVGRMAMPSRAAFVHRPGEALADRLRSAARAIASRGREAGVHLGTAEDGQDILGSDTESAAFVRSLVAGGKLDRIAALWVKGAEVDWRILGGARGRRVSLPGYPFARTRHWVPTLHAEPASAPKQAEPVRLVPLERKAPDLPPAVTSVPEPSRDREAIREIVAELAAGVLYLDVGAIDRDANVADLGFDSILVVELVKMLNERLGTSFAATRLYDFRTLNGLADHLHTLMAGGEADREEPATQEPAAAAPEPSEVPQAPASSGEVSDWLRAALARVLYLSEEAIDERTSFAELGLDSILAVELAKAINDRFVTDLPATRIFDQPNVAALAQQIEERLSRPASAPVTADPAAVGRIVAALRREVAGVLAVEPESIDVRAPLDAFAIDPPAAGAIVESLRSELGVALELAEIGGCRDLEAVAALIADRTTTPTAPKVSEAAPAGTAPATADPEAERILDVIREQVRMILPDVPPEAVTLESSLAELGANSMDRVEVATYSMEQLAVVVPPAAMRDVANVGDLVEILRRYAHAA